MSGFGKRAVCGLLGGDNGRLVPVQCVQVLLVRRGQSLHQFVEIMKRTGVLQVLAASERPRVERFDQVLLDFVEMHRFQRRGSRGNRREELCVQRTPDEKAVHVCASRICGQPLPRSSLHPAELGPPRVSLLNRWATGRCAPCGGSLPTASVVEEEGDLARVLVGIGVAQAEQPGECRRESDHELLHFRIADARQVGIVEHGVPAAGVQLLEERVVSNRADDQGVRLVANRETRQCARFTVLSFRDLAVEVGGIVGFHCIKYYAARSVE